jgi:hypothetical protein
VTPVSIVRAARGYRVCVAISARTQLRAPADILEDILGYFVLRAFAAPFGYIISDSDIGYFAIFKQISGFADQIFGYFAILKQISGFADQIFGYSAVLQQISGFADRIFGYFLILLQV